MQRDREFSSYEDPRYEYHKRPSAWVEPVNSENWENGYISLYRIPTRDDLMDNIVVFYSPEKLPTKGDNIKFSYNIKMIDKLKLDDDFAEVVSTKIIQNKDKNLISFFIDFKGLDLKNFEEKDYKFNLEGEDYEVLEYFLNPINNLDKLRVSIKLSQKNKNITSSTISGFISEDSKIKSEVWKFIND